jgi:hypothetical protein
VADWQSLSVVAGSPASSVVVGSPGSSVVVGSPGSSVVVGSPASSVVVGSPASSAVLGSAASSAPAGHSGSSPRGAGGLARLPSAEIRSLMSDHPGFGRPGAIPAVSHFPHRFLTRRAVPAARQ